MLDVSNHASLPTSEAQSIFHDPVAGHDPARLQTSLHALVDVQAKFEKAGHREDARDTLWPIHLCQKRLNRVEGQVRGLSRMVEEERYCIDVVTQIAAVRAALRRIEELVLKDHVGHCVEHAIASGDPKEQRAKIAELMDVLGRTDR